MVIVGVGNVYCNELFFWYWIDLQWFGCGIGELEFDVVWNDLVLLMKVGLCCGKIIVVCFEYDYGLLLYLFDWFCIYVYC